MAYSAPRHGDRLSVAAFRAWCATRPEEERWELIDGVPVMMTPPTLAHQRIASNLETLLNAALEAAQLPLEAFQRAGVNLAGTNSYDPEPDVAVIDRPLDSDQRYSDRFYLAAEVVSRSDEPIVDAKCQRYREHAHCVCVLVIRQDRPEVTQYLRAGDTWTATTLDRLADELIVEACALRCRLADLYRRVPGIR
jgi:Uma2 family endonuclease